MLNSNLLRKLDMQDLMVFIAVYDQSKLLFNIGFVRKPVVPNSVQDNAKA